MATVLAYVDAVPGRLYPLVPTLLELMRRGYRVALRCGVDELERIRSVGLAAEPSRPRSSASRLRTGARGLASGRSGPG